MLENRHFKLQVMQFDSLLETLVVCNKIYIDSFSS